MLLNGWVHNLAMLTVYAPHLDVEATTKDAFDLNIHQVISRIQRNDLLIIAENLNARLRSPDNTFRADCRSARHHCMHQLAIGPP